MRFSLRWKAAMIIAGIAVCLSSVSILASYRFYTGTMNAYYENTALNVAKVAASQVDADAVTGYLKTGIRDEKYERTLGVLRDIKDNSGIRYLYLVRPQKKGAYFVYDTDTSEKRCELGYRMKYYPGAFKDNLSEFLAGNRVKSIISNEEYGWVMSVFQPIFDTQGKMSAYVCVDISMDKVIDDKMGFLYQLGLILAGLAAAVTLLFLWMTDKVIVCPVVKMSGAARCFLAENSHSPEKKSAISEIEIHSHDEIRFLADAIKEMEKNIYEYIETLTAVTVERERIGAELNVATQIQADMLPRIFPAFPERADVDVYAVMIPAKEVGGDFYDFFLIDENHLAIVIADVSGKGVPAALFMVIAKTLIKNHALSGKSPGEIFTAVNDQLCEGNEAGLFVTAWMGILELSTGSLKCVNAGHNPPLLKHQNKKFDWLKLKAGFVLAGMKGIRYQTSEIYLNPQDRIFLYTDGASEAADINNRLFGDERLKTTVEAAGAYAPKKMLEVIKDSIDKFVGNAEQFDDITMLVLKYTPSVISGRR